MTWKTPRHTFNFATEQEQRGVLMGILNTTPDSFSDGGDHIELVDCVDAGLAMEEDGAAIIDIGGESTRPGASAVSEAEETQRTEPVIRALREKSEILISIDTSKASVAKVALEAGADIVNDVTGLTGDPEMLDICVNSTCGIVVMHMQGNPRMMQQSPSYEKGVVNELRGFFTERLESLTQAGIEPERICFDPGIGFGKTVDQNLTLIRYLPDLQKELGRPFLLGVSRKSIIGAVTEIEDPSDRDSTTAVMTAMSFKQGIMLHRVHDIKTNAQALRIANAM